MCMNHLKMSAEAYIKGYHYTLWQLEINPLARKTAAVENSNYKHTKGNNKILESSGCISEPN